MALYIILVKWENVAAAAQAAAAAS